MKYSLLIFSSENEFLRNVFASDFEVNVIDKSQPLIDQIRHIKPQLLIIDEEILLSEKDQHYSDLTKDKVYHDLPVIAYYSGQDEIARLKLYQFNVKGIIQKGCESKRFLECAHNVLARSNPHVGSERDKFIKAFISYEDGRSIIIDALYLANYLLRYYRIDAENASNVRLAVILLTIGLKKRKTLKVLQLIQSFDFSPLLIDYLKNYHKPKTVEEKIIIAAMTQIEYDNKNPLLAKAYESLEAEIIQTTNDAVEHHKIYIACAHDIYVFVMRLNKILGEASGEIEKIEKYILHLSDILFHTLVKYGNFYAQITVDDGAYCIGATLESESLPFDEHTTSMLTCYCEDKSIEFQVSKYSLLACMKFDGSDDNTFPTNNAPSTIFPESDPIACSVTSALADTGQPECKQRQVDMGFINCMHYEDHQKITAKAFLEEFEYDTALIDDLNENENDAKDALYFDENLTASVLDSVIVTFVHYTHIFNETIEFRDLAYSVNSLITLLQSIDVESLEETKQKTLKTYLTGIFDNLANWKMHIFIAQDCPDIHYLDASLLSDCALVESLFTTVTNEDESELEFF
ncbi:hypothetical protein Sulku_0962 [Sulfuricurvum kujiense DSM 16994]|uniref:Uncharacterized protein n=1 Tax=Sulfuricurvum kujiense (strain ATCC BAA-921 / DSM 16994 / JCM 11577 / YK-1) TaxID=709032 RepID=E4U2P1_SULKY|nr:hypothetical protein [Sulfuricurvum kujiense]ADR33626.1 hypothetical protein Sulku_0962 [Sulfuricurvum kujiense DSM 16994]